MILAVEHWPLLLGLSVTAALGVGLALRWRSRPDARLAEDAEDPYRRWVQNTFLMVTGDCDYAHISGAEARRILAHWWDVYGPQEHRLTLERLASPAQDNAWDLVRYILVSRLGVAAGLIPQEVSWAEILPVARRLQATYDDWRAMGLAYVRARRQWRQLPLDGSADDPSMMQILDNLAQLQDTRWAELPFDTELHLAQPEGADA